MLAARLFIVEVVALFDHRYVYAVVPPEAVTVAFPSLPPSQLTFFWAVIDADNAAGCVMIAEVVAVHEWASVTVTV